MPPADREEQRRPVGDGATHSFVAVSAVFGVLGSLCVISIISVLVCRLYKATHRDDTTPRSDVDDGHVTTTVADIITENLDDDVPTATEIELTIENAKLTMPPASTEDMDSIPVAVTQVVDSV